MLSLEGRKAACKTIVEAADEQTPYWFERKTQTQKQFHRDGAVGTNICALGIQMGPTFSYTSNDTYQRLFEVVHNAIAHIAITTKNPYSKRYNISVLSGMESDHCAQQLKV